MSPTAGGAPGRERTSVVIADDHPIVRSGIAALLSAQPDLEVIGEAKDGLELVELTLALSPAVVIVDLEMPGGDGLHATTVLSQQRPKTRIVVFTVHDNSERVRMLLTAGASAYVSKCSPNDILLHAISIVTAGGTYVDPAVTPARPAPTQPLSERETEVLRWVARGYSLREIAARLGLSVKTVETYKARCTEKLQLRRRADLVRYAIDQGWLGDD